MCLYPIIGYKHHGEFVRMRSLNLLILRLCSGHPSCAGEAPTHAA